MPHGRPHKTRRRIPRELVKDIVDAFGGSSRVRRRRAMRRRQVRFSRGKKFHRRAR